jgi:prophage regulatory protein
MAKILRSKHVAEKTGYSRMQIHRLEIAGKFPKRFRLGPNSVGWLESEIEAWIEEKAKDRQ